MAGFPPKSGKPVTEKKKRKRPSKKVPTTVLESSSTNFMDLVQKLTGSAAELASDTTTKSIHNDGEKRPKSTPSPVSETSYFQDYLQSAIATSYNDNDSSSSSHSTYTPASPFSQPANFMAMGDLTSGYNSQFAEALGDDEDFYNSGYTGASNSSSSRAMENDVSLFSSSWREPSDYWYHQMDAMRA